MHFPSVLVIRVNGLIGSATVVHDRTMTDGADIVTHGNLEVRRQSQYGLLICTPEYDETASASPEGSSDPTAKASTSPDEPSTDTAEGTVTIRCPADMSVLFLNSSGQVTGPDGRQRDMGTRPIITT